MMLHPFLIQYGLPIMIVAPLLAAMGLVMLRGSLWATLMCIVGAGASLIIGMILVVSLRHAGGMEFFYEFMWIPQWNVSFAVAMDGLSYYFVIITIVLLPIGLYIDDGFPTYRRRRIFLLLIYEAAMIGLYCSVDIFLFLFFLELATLSVFFYLGHLAADTKGWGSKRFLALNLIASGSLFIALLGTYSASGESSHLGYLLQHKLDAAQQSLWCGFFLLGVSIKGALVPWHSWFRDVEARANPGALIAVNGLFLPVAGYSAIRFGYALFPDGFMAWRPTFLFIIFAGLFLSAIWGWGSKRKPFVMAYMSVAIVAWIFLGLVSVSGDGSRGAIYLMAQHAWIMGLAAVIVAMQSGHGDRAPTWTKILGVVCCLAMMAFPGSGTFVAFLLIAGAVFHEYPFWISCGLGAWILLGGLVWRDRDSLFDGHAAVQRRSPLVVGLLGVGLALLIIWSGLHPNPFLSHIQRDSDAWLTRFHAGEARNEEFRP